MIGFFNPVYPLIYNATYDWYIGFCYCLSNTILLIMIGILVYCSWFWKKVSKNAPHHEDKPEDNDKAKTVRSFSIQSAESMVTEL